MLLPLRWRIVVGTLGLLVLNQLVYFYFLNNSSSSSTGRGANQPRDISAKGPVLQNRPERAKRGSAVPEDEETCSAFLRMPVICHPEVCERAMCNESCGQVPKITSECRGAECHHENKRLIYKAQLSYPAFIMPMPSFVDKNVETMFLNMSVVRQTYMEEHGKCPSKFAQKDETRCKIIGEFDKNRELVMTHKRYVYGEISIVADGVWRGKPDASFGAYQCWEGSNYTWIINSVGEAAQSFKKAVVMLTPVTGGAYFQHFIDRGWSKLIQVWDFIQDPETKILVHPKFRNHPNVIALWKRFGLEDRLVFVQPGKDIIHAKEMIFPCVATHYHPLVYQRAQQYLGIDPYVPLDKRKKIVYFTRKNNLRKVRNEDQLVADIQAWLVENKRSEELTIFNHQDWPSFDELVNFFNQEVVAAIGPHGGALYNVLFTARNTTVIELFPVKPNGDAFRWPECIWWPAHFLGLRYFQVPVTSQDGSIVVASHLVTDILHKQLLASVEVG